MKITVKTKGFKELERALADELPKAVAKNVLRRTAINAMKPVETRAKQLAPVDDGTLERTIKTKPVKIGYVAGSRTRRKRANGVTVAVGPTGRPAGGNAAWQEFGTVDQPAQPFMRPAWDIEHPAVLEDVRKELTSQIDKAKTRIARKVGK